MPQMAPMMWSLLYLYALSLILLCMVLMTFNKKLENDQKDAKQSSFFPMAWKW